MLLPGKKHKRETNEDKVVKEYLHILIAVGLLAGWIIVNAQETRQTNLIPAAPMNAQP